MVSNSLFSAFSVALIIYIPFLSTIVSSASSPSAPTTCYFIDGRANVNAGFRCNNQTSGHSSCCATGSLCYSNGVCQQTNQGYQDYLRVGCTDPTWKDPACLEQCTIYANRSTAGIRFCEGAITSTNKYCCDDGAFGIGSFHCCNTPSAIFAINPIATVLAQIPLSYIPTTSSSSSTTTTSSSSTIGTPGTLASATSDPSTSPSDSSPPSPSTKRRLPLILGISIPLASLAILLAVFFIYRRKRCQRRRQNVQAPQIYDQLSPSELDASKEKSRTAAVYEMPGSMR